MHPDPAFRWDEAQARAFVAAEGFGALFAATPDGPRVAHVPVVVTGDGALRFHLSRGNALTAHLCDATALFVVQGPHAYISPGWYEAGPDQVPTWNYVAVEVDGIVRAIDRAALREQFDAMAATYEGEGGWAVDAMAPPRAEAMMNAIAGFELIPTAWRTTTKLSQNKPEPVRRRVIAALGDHPLAAWMRAGVLGGALLLGACGDGGGSDWLLAGAPDPAGGRVARLWCADFCDVPGRTTLTLSPKARSVPATAAVEGFPPMADMPEEDVILTFDAGGGQGAPVAARWTGPRELTVTAPCPAARDAASGDVAIRLRATDCKAPA